MGRYDDVFYRFCLRCSDIIGMTPKAGLLNRIIFVYISSPLFLVLEGLILYKLRFSEGDVFKVVDIMESATTFCTAILRKPVMIFYGKLVDDVVAASALSAGHFRSFVSQLCDQGTLSVASTDVFEDRNSFFWDYDKCGKELGDKFRKAMNFLVLFNKGFISITVITIALMCLGTFVNEDQELPMECWIPGDNPLARNIIYFFQIILIAEIEFLFGAFDGFFLLICMDIKIQFDLIIETMRSINFANTTTKEGREFCLKTIKDCVIHHNKLLGAFRKLSPAFPTFFVSEYFLSIFQCSVQFYLLSTGTATMEHAMKSIVYLSALLLCLIEFYLPACLLSDKAEEFSEALYGLEWYEAEDVTLQRDILFMLMRSQEPVALTWGGMFNVNRTQMIQIFRTAFSICTLLKQLR